MAVSSERGKKIVITTHPMRSMNVFHLFGSDIVRALSVLKQYVFLLLPSTLFTVIITYP